MLLEMNSKFKAFYLKYTIGTTIHMLVFKHAHIRQLYQQTISINQPRPSCIFSYTQCWECWTVCKHLPGGLLLLTSLCSNETMLGLYLSLCYYSGTELDIRVSGLYVRDLGRSADVNKIWQLTAPVTPQSGVFFSDYVITFNKLQCQQF